MFNKGATLKKGSRVFINLNSKQDDERIVTACQIVDKVKGKRMTVAAVIRYALENLNDNHCPECGAQLKHRACRCKAPERI